MQLCRSDTLQGKNEIKARWGVVDNYVLVCKYVLHDTSNVIPARHQAHRIASLNVDEEADIDWKSLNDDSWTWTSRSLQQRWRRLKASVDTDGKSHHGKCICSAWILLVDFTHIPHRCPS